MNRNPDDPNKGLNVKRYLTLVAGALVVLMIGILIVAHTSADKATGNAAKPKPMSPASP